MDRPSDKISRSHRDRRRGYSLAELLVAHWPSDVAACEGVLRLAEGVENDDAVCGALLYYRALALRGLGMNDVAQKTLSSVLRRKKGRPRDLLDAVRYERAVTCLAVGKRAQACKDLEALYAERPSFRDVARRLSEAGGRTVVSPPRVS